MSEAKATPAQALLKQLDVDVDPDVETTSFSLNRSVGLKGGRADFTFTPVPPDATPAVECAIWIYDSQRLDEWL